MISAEEIQTRLDVIETDMNRMTAENLRLLSEKESVYVERDSCIALMVQIAIKQGFNAGLVDGNIVVLDLPSGQVSWDFAESEAHLFEMLPAYTKPLEEISIGEKYRRVMNPEIL